MPAANLMLLLLIGTIFGVLAAVVLRGRRSVFIINVLLGIMGAVIGAFLPVLLGTAKVVDVSAMDYLLRALFGAFLLVLVASLFRSSRPESL